MYEHIVVGAGVNGLSAAYQLAKRGRKVLLLEKVCVCQKCDAVMHWPQNNFGLEL